MPYSHGPAVSSSPFLSVPALSFSSSVSLACLHHFPSVSCFIIMKQRVAFNFSLCGPIGTKNTFLGVAELSCLHKGLFTASLHKQVRPYAGTWMWAPLCRQTTSTEIFSLPVHTYQIVVNNKESQLWSFDSYGCL